MLAKHCLDELKLDCQLRRLTARTIKGYYNNTLNFLVYVEKHHGITEVEEIYTLHIKHYVQYLLSKKLTATYTNNMHNNNYLLSRTGRPLEGFRMGARVILDVLLKTA